MAIELDTIYCLDALDMLRGLDAGSVQLIIADPPYYKVKDSAWDNQWDTPAAFIAWLQTIFTEMQRVLASNGSLYLFASPRMAARVEVATADYFNVLNHVRWIKDAGWHNRTSKDDIRGYLSNWESVIFAEHQTTNDGYSQAEYELNGRVFYPLKSWFRGRAKMYAIGLNQMNEALGAATNGGGLASGYFGQKCEFQLPTKERYHQMQVAFPQAFNREYEELRKEYEDLRREYEDLRRPFNSTPDLPYTDVWTYKTVNAYPGKHECEKPLDMMRDIVTLSSRPGDVVLDPFCGSGASLKAARQLGRRYIGCDSSPHWVDYARVNINANRQIRFIEHTTNGTTQLSLFSD